MNFNYFQCKQRGFSIIYVLIGVLMLVGIAGGTYYFGKSQPSKPQSPVRTQQLTITSTITPSTVPDETANWKTFTESVYNYSIKYPEKSAPLGGASNNPAYVGFSFKRVGGNSPSIVNIHIVTGLQYNLNKYINIYTIIHEVIRYNNETVIISGDAGWGGEPVATEEDKQYLIEVFNKMVSTLKFLN